MIDAPLASDARALAIAAAQREAITLCAIHGMPLPDGGERLAESIEASVIKLHAAAFSNPKRDVAAEIARRFDKRGPLAKLLQKAPEITTEQRDAVDSMAWVFAASQAVAALKEILEQNNQKE